MAEEAAENTDEAGVDDEDLDGEEEALPCEPLFAAAAAVATVSARCATWARSLALIFSSRSCRSDGLPSCSSIASAEGMDAAAEEARGEPDERPCADPPLPLPRFLLPFLDGGDFFPLR